MRLAVRLLIATALLVSTPAIAEAAGVGPTHWSGSWTGTVPFYGSVMATDERGTIVAGYDGEVVAFDLEGNEQWTAREDLTKVVNTPALVAAVVVVPSKSGIVGLDRAAGSRLWRSGLESARLARGRADGRPVVLVTTPDGRLRTLDPASGTVLMERALPFPPPDGAALVEGSGEAAFVAWSSPEGCCSLAGLSTSDGTLLWERQVTEESTEPVIHDGLVIVGMNGPQWPRGRIVAFDVETGERRWRTPIRTAGFLPTLAAGAADDVVVVADREGAVIAVDVRTGAVRWQSDPTIAAEQAHPKVAAEHVFLTPHSTDLVAFDRATGEVVSGGPIEQAIVVTDTDVVDGHFQLLVTNGFEGQVWNFEPDGLRTD